MPSARSTEQAAVVATDAGKRFGGFWALRGASVTLRAGRIHALVGENGAGKSTLLGILGGRLRADEGTLDVAGTPVAGGSPRASRRAGIATVHQELMLVPHLTLAENLFLGHWRTRGGFVDRRAQRAEATALLDRLRVDLPLGRRAAQVSLAHQQMTEILRAVLADAAVLLLDEPSAALAEAERATLHTMLDQLRSEGHAIGIVSHDLDEVLGLADDVSVLREGRLVASRPRSAWDRPSLIEHMVGTRAVTPSARAIPAAAAPVAVQVRGVRAGRSLDGVDLEVRRGEVVGLWGLVGSGRSTLLRAIAGAQRAAGGEMLLDGEPRPLPRSVVESGRAGIALVPESRRAALVAGMDAAANFHLGRSRPWLSPQAERAVVRPWLSRFGFAADRHAVLVGRLSGGNQQKVLMAKWAGRVPRVLLVDEPTRGIDLAAKTEVLDSLVDLARGGTAVVVASSELEEVLAIATRLVVLARGRVAAEFDLSEEPRTVAEILAHGFTPEGDLR
ncbi:sugar ABC transporter ATP-binding protein [Pseudonocardia xishanensis]|uniref:Sugar ABC transporter ATP-binding protein n=1 Tax=Pseudonocardia xishanensis TaxID=630995 RepID=A0ABP8S1D5_9PSEU